MMRRFERRGVAAVALGVLVVAACGGEASGGGHYSVAGTSDCLTARSAPVSTSDDDLDYIAMDAGEGALASHAGENRVTIVFERTDSDATRTEKAYQAFGGTSDNLARHGNAVIAWDKTPTDDERHLVEGCLG